MRDLTLTPRIRDLLRGSKGEEVSTMPRSTKPQKRIRVRSKSLAEIDETKLALAFWLMAKRLIEEEDAETDREPSAP